MKYFKILFIFVSFIFTSCNSNDYIKIQGEAHGTLYSIIFEGNQETLSKQEIDSLTRAFDQSLSTYIDNSLISKLNRSSDGMKVDSLFVRMYNIAKEVNQNSEGAFDITIAPLVNIYGFGYGKKLETIDQNVIDSVLHYIGMEKIELKGDFLYKKHPLVEIDGNSIAKGLSVDNTAEFLLSKGIKNFLIEIGGEITAKGKAKDRNWIVGIDSPLEGNFEPGKYLEARIMLKDMSLATSGNYRRFYKKDGKKYVHTINPKTGKPEISKLLSVTIIAPNCTLADAYATACMAMGYEKGKKMIDKLPDIDAFFIMADEDGNFVTDMTSGMKKHIVKDKE